MDKKVSTVGIIIGIGILSLNFNGPSEVWAGQLPSKLIENANKQALQSNDVENSETDEAPQLPVPCLPRESTEGSFSYLTAYESQRTSFEPKFPDDVMREILKNVSGADLIRFSRTRKDAKQLVISATKMKGFKIDLKDVNLDENQFKSLFMETGIFHFATGLVLSDTSFQPEWIKYLPVDRLASIQFATTTGAILTYNGKHPTYPNELGDGWRDPNGNIWYEPLREANGDLKKTNFVTAIQSCHNYGLSLPTISKFRELGTFFGAKYNPVFISPFTNEYWDDEDRVSGRMNKNESSYKPQALKDLEFEFWSLSPDTKGSGRILYFNGGIHKPYLPGPGNISAIIRSGPLEVRCIDAKSKDPIDGSLEHPGVANQLIHPDFLDFLSDGWHRLNQFDFIHNGILYEEYLDIESNLAEVQFNRAKELFSKGNFEGALRLLKKAAAKDHQEARQWLRSI